ncbi:MAG: three-Cys-motif partner protein TcmP [Alphaproteobacteria bacterium]|nr:three-Cys-motif partner protein TcmP [Alphaproteobacteria bacterium]
MRAANAFGGPWTEEKLGILERYLDFYTTALKKQAFKLLYIDAFAGSGEIQITGEDAEEAQNFIIGSTHRAINITDKPFGKLIFVEKNKERYMELLSVRNEFPNRDIEVENADANSFLRDFTLDWKQWRGVLFLDPFATEISWSTIKKIADFNALDMWILFPTQAISRILPREQRPEDIEPRWMDRLDRIYGNDSWKALYRQNPQGDSFGHSGHQRDRGVEGLTSIYRSNLESLFGNRFLQKTRKLRNSKNAVLFEFLFCVGNERGKDLASRVANYILDDL